MIRRIAFVALKEWRFFRRGTLAYAVLALPVILSVVWGYCISLDIEDAPLAVLDAAGGPEARALVRGVESTGAFRVAARADSQADFERALVRGEAVAGLAIPASLGRDLDRGRAARARLVADGTDATIAGEGLDYATRAVGRADLPRPSPRPADAPRVDARVRTWYARSLRGRDFLLLNAVIYYLLAIIYNPSGSLMTDRDRGALACLRGTPLRAVELWLGVVVTHVGVALWGALVQIGAALACGVPFRGSAGVLLGGLALVALTHVNIGCTIPGFASRLEQRTVLVTLFTFVTIAFSGYLLPLEFLPAWVRPIADALPVTHGLALVRGAFLKGADAAALRHALVALGTLAAGSSAAAVLVLRSLLHDEGAR
jgi:ABC-2 type transport system permease protein